MTHPGSGDLNDLVENAGDIIQSVDMEGRYLLVNRRWREVLGYEADDIARLRLSDVIRADHREECGRLFAELAGGRDLPTLTTVFVTRDGRSVEVEGRVSLRRDEAGKPVATRGIFRDVTETRAAGRRIEELLRTNRAILENTPVGIALFSADGRCLEANDALGRMVGAPRERIVGLDFRRLESWQSHGLTERALECLRTGEPVTHETWMETSFGVVACLRCRFVAVEMDGRPHLLFLSEDITADRRREEALLAYQRRLVDLHAIAHELASQTDLDRVLQTAADRARELVRADFGAIVRMDPETGKPCGLYPSNYPMEAIPAGTVVEGRGLLGRVASGETVHTARARDEAGFVGLPDWHPRLGPLLGLPVTDRGRVMAMLLAGRSDGAAPFDADDRSLLETIANLAAVAMRISEQFTELQQANARLEDLASNDQLMHIGNRRAFDLAIETLHAVALRYSVPFGIVMADMDHFKAYNDLYGHPAGDRVLTAVATSLKNTIRAMDKVFRYGGEELVLLLPHQTAAGTVAAAERLRGCIQKLGLEHRGNPPGVVTLSFGCAVFDPRAAGEGARSWQDTLRAADEALYRAKAAGRNRVEADDPGAPC